MSGTPSISESYAIVGNRLRSGLPGRFDLRISLVVLTRSPGLFRTQILDEFHALGFSEILWVEKGPPWYDPQPLLQAFPGLRFLFYREDWSPGAMVNTAAREIRGERFLVVWDDQTFPESGLQSRVQKLWDDSASIAVVPERRDSRGRELPSVLVPCLEKDRLKILSLGADQEMVDTLSVPDYTALYDRHRFLQSGGFDPELTNPFWQRTDWGVRCRLWGETLTFVRSFKVDYRSETPLEDQTPDRSYPRFYLRNLGVRHAGDHGFLPVSRLWAHLRRSGLPWNEGLGGFFRERAWVKVHRYRFKTDARLLAELWGNP